MRRHSVRTHTRKGHTINAHERGEKWELYDGARNKKQAEEIASGAAHYGDQTKIVRSNEPQFPFHVYTKRRV